MPWKDPSDPCYLLPPLGVFPRGLSLGHHWRSIVYIQGVQRCISPFNQFLKNKRINFSASTNPICHTNNWMNNVKNNKCTASVREYWNWRRNSKLEFLGKLNFVPLNSNYISIICQIKFSWLSSFVLLFFFSFQFQEFFFLLSHQEVGMQPVTA